MASITLTFTANAASVTVVDERGSKTYGHDGARGDEWDDAAVRAAVKEFRVICGLNTLFGDADVRRLDAQHGERVQASTFNLVNAVGI